MILRSILLQHFRSYTQQKFDFDPVFTAIIGPNTAGKTNLSEAISLLATGKSFRTSTDVHMIEFGEEIGRVQGLLEETKETKETDETKGENIQIDKYPNKQMVEDESQVVSRQSVEEPIGKKAAKEGEDSGQARMTVKKSRDDSLDKTKIEVVLASREAAAHSTSSGSSGRFSKKFFINGIVKSRNALRGLLPLVLFRPEELDIITDGPALRRSFLDDVLEQVDKEYYQANITYQRALRQRNALLRIAQDTGRRNVEQFDYWDNLLIANGQTLTHKREEFIDFLNHAPHDIFPVTVVYDRSTISEERLLQYTDAEVGAGLTLVGPHRDDFIVELRFTHKSTQMGKLIDVIPHPDLLPQGEKETMEKLINRDIRHFGSRGQQRLAVLQLKMLQIEFIKNNLKIAPLLVLDDIFSELDSGHIELVLEKVEGCQVILTTTHREFIPNSKLKAISVIELER